MKFKEVFNQTKNRANNQISFNLKKKKLRKVGLTPEQLMELNIPKLDLKLKQQEKYKGVKRWKLQNN